MQFLWCAIVQRNPSETHMPQQTNCFPHGATSKGFFRTVDIKCALNKRGCKLDSTIKSTYNINIHIRTKVLHEREKKSTSITDGHNWSNMALCTHTIYCTEGHNSYHVTHLRSIRSPYLATLPLKSKQLVNA